ncbi:MAG: tetratricopeptide repeat protein [Bacteroidales bacterium]|jgi:tetratricopeptide (TPR) repeat protein|nr:tetratricopeptide repeat protein [Bacteroidales bacterium]
MKITITILFLHIILLTSAFSQPTRDCSDSNIYSGFIKGDMNVWKNAMPGLQMSYFKTMDPCHLFTLIEARYGYIGYLIGIGNKNDAKPVVDSFEIDLEALSAFPQYEAETEAFRVALLGFRMGLNPARAMVLGPKALKQLDTAMAVGSNNAAVWIEKANSEANMPSFAGGSKTKAVESYKEALRLFEADTNLSRYSWRYLNTLVLLGKTYEKLDDYGGAREAYLKALKREPSFTWVRDELLPANEKNLIKE